VILIFLIAKEGHSKECFAPGPEPL